MEWRCWFYVYLMWHESGGLRTRSQTAPGTARGLMQFEAATAWDVIKIYVMGPTPGLVARLAAAAGVDRATVAIPVIKAFAALPNPGPVWPPIGLAKQIEHWLLAHDSFGIELMQMQFARYRVFIPGVPVRLLRGPRSPAARQSYANLWADAWWRGAQKVRAKRIADFMEDAAGLNVASPPT